MILKNDQEAQSLKSPGVKNCRDAQIERLCNYLCRDILVRQVWASVFLVILTTNRLSQKSSVNGEALDEVKLCGNSVFSV
jgi:hypothetical protein